MQNAERKELQNAEKSFLGPDSEQCGRTSVASQCLTSKVITPSKSPVLQKNVQIKDRLSARKYILIDVHVQFQ